MADKDRYTHAGEQAEGHAGEQAEGHAGEQAEGHTEEQAEGRTGGEVPFRLFTSSKEQKRPSVDMDQVVGSQDILLICLDTLRYDVAAEEAAAGNTPVLNRYGPWEKCQAPGNFTYPSHHAMFAGFFPCRYGPGKGVPWIFPEELLEPFLCLPGEGQYQEPGGLPPAQAGESG